MEDLLKSCYRGIFDGEIHSCYIKRKTADQRKAHAVLFFAGQEKFILKITSANICRSSPT